MENETRQAYIKRLWNANTSDEIAAILDEYDAEQLPAKPEPNWDEAPDWANWWAVDESGQSWFYKNKPFVGDHQWVLDANHYDIKVSIIIDLQCYDWRETLTQRPQ